MVAFCIYYNLTKLKKRVTIVELGNPIADKALIKRNTKVRKDYSYFQWYFYLATIYFEKDFRTDFFGYYMINKICPVQIFLFKLAR